MPQAKEYDFIITLRRSNRIINLISILLCLLAVSISLYSFTYVSFLYTALYVALALDIFVIVFLLYAFYKKPAIVKFRWPLTAAALIWFLPPVYNLIIALLYVVASFIERQLKLPQEIGFDKEEIVINSFASKQYPWEEISNVVLKDNMLTIDFKNNKILQRETEYDVNRETEKEFNDFCVIHLKS